MAVYHGAAFTYPPTRHNVVVIIRHDVFFPAWWSEFDSSRWIGRSISSWNSFWLGKCYTLLHSGMDFQWILEAQRMPPHKVPPPVSGVLPKEKWGLAWKFIEWVTIRRSSPSECIEELVLGQNSFCLRNCYDLLHSGMEFQWILEAQSMRRPKVTPPVSEFYPWKSEVLMVVINR